MGLFHKDTIDPHVEEYHNAFKNYINGLQDINELYKAFSEITILRLRLDKNDGILRNIIDKLERSNEFDIKQLILLQFDDIMNSCKKYKKCDYDKIDTVMNIILPKGSATQNAWNKFWSSLKEGLDNAAGRKKA